MNEFFNSLYGSRSAARLPAGLTTLIAIFCDIIHVHLLNEMVSGSSSGKDKQYLSHTYNNLNGNDYDDEDMSNLFSNANRQKHNNYNLNHHHHHHHTQDKNANRHDRYTSAHEMNSSAAQHKIS